MNLKITDLLDDYMDDFPVDIMPVPDTTRIKEATMKRMHKGRFTRPVRMMLIAAAIVVLLAGTVFAVWQYTRITDTMEENWNVQAETPMTEEQKDFVESKVAGIGESVTDQGVTVTIDSVRIASKMAYVSYSIGLDPELFDIDGEISISDWFTEFVAVHEDYGEIPANVGSGSGDFAENGVAWRVAEPNFSSNLPEDANLGDGKTTMRVEMSSIIIKYLGEDREDIDISGNWNFEFLLPETEVSPAKTSDISLGFGDDIILEISDIAIEEYGCTFTVATDNNEYIFANNGMEAEMAHAAEPDAPYFTVEARLEDGTKIPSNGASMSNNVDSPYDQWTIQWSAPVDPETVVSLIFSDGTTEVEVPLN